MTQFVKKEEVQVADEVIIERNKSIINREDVQQYISMLSYKRPSAHTFSDEYKEFIDKFLIPYFGKPDRHGNFILINPDAEGNHPRIAYMAHHDTVHTRVGRQNKNIKYNPTALGDVYVHIQNENVPKITRKQTYKDNKTGKMVEKEYETIDTQDEFYSNCLGADCTTGVWLIIQMIQSGCPGVYVIHEDEEIGCIGSGCIVDDYNRMTDEEKENHWLSKIDICMSFDRYGEKSIITYQSSSRTASDEFASSLSNMFLPFFEARGYKPLEADDGGSYTDSNEYADIISECTNISVGYYNQHTSSEKQNIDYLLMLRDCLIEHANDMNDPTKLIAVRDPSEVDYLYGGRWGGYNHNYRGSSQYNRRDNSYTFGYDPTDPFGYDEYPSPYSGRYDDSIYLADNSTDRSHTLSVSEIEDIEYTFEDYVQQTIECGDLFNTDAEEEIELISEWLRLFPYIAASLMQNNGIGSKEFISRMKAEAARRDRFNAMDELFKKDKERMNQKPDYDEEIPF